MSESMTNFKEALGIDVGSKRIGVARVSAVAKIPQPVTTIAMSDDAVSEIIAIAKNEGADLLVVGLPRNLASEDTEQTSYSRAFADKLKESGLAVVLQDEALSSKSAEQLIKNGTYSKNQNSQPVSIDEVAACVILNDFIGAIPL
jgi:putative Holliday junction resolvase